MKIEVKFRPLQRETLSLLFSTFEACNDDPFAAYARLLSATMVAAAIINLRPEQLAQQVDACGAMAKKAVAERPEIFGKMEQAE